jgi:hypothetical protein
MILNTAKVGGAIRQLFGLNGRWRLAPTWSTFRRLWSRTSYVFKIRF